MNRWDEYLAATVRLDEVRRESAATVAAQQATAGATTAELTAVRQRIALQRTRIVEIATSAGRAVPSLEPLDADRNAVATLSVPVVSGGPVDGGRPPGAEALDGRRAPHGEALHGGRAPDGEAAPPGDARARRTVADATADITVALQRVRATLDAADATLSMATSGPAQRGLLAGRPPGVRNAIVYGWFALLALVAIIEINSIVGDSLQASVVIAVFALLVPAGAWLLGWVTLRLLFGRTGAMEMSLVARRLGDTAYRPSGGVVGALLCAVPLIVGLILSVV
jgi:hypothetical protein